MIFGIVINRRLESKLIICSVLTVGYGFETGQFDDKKEKHFITLLRNYLINQYHYAHFQKISSYSRYLKVLHCRKFNFNRFNEGSKSACFPSTSYHRIAVIGIAFTQTQFQKRIQFHGCNIISSFSISQQPMLKQSNEVEYKIKELFVSIPT